MIPVNAFCVTLELADTVCAALDVILKNTNSSSSHDTAMNETFPIRLLARDDRP